jgi:hypothetical protein
MRGGSNVAVRSDVVDDPIWRILEHRFLNPAWLARKIRRKYSYVWHVRRGDVPVTLEFRKACAEVLDLPDDLLFTASRESRS